MITSLSRWKCRHDGLDEQSEAEQKTSSSSSSSLPPNAKRNDKMITLGLLTPNNIEVVKRINRGTFPMNYSERFYDSIVDFRELCRLAFVCDIPVGAVCCRLVFPGDAAKDFSSSSSSDIIDTSNPSLTPPKLHQWQLTTPQGRPTKKSTDIPTARLCIMTLAVLAAYRRSGIGSLLLQWVVDRCKQLRSGEAEFCLGGVPGLPQGQGQVNVTDIYLHVWSANREGIEFYKNHGFIQDTVIGDYYKSLTPSDCIVFRKVIP
ncbi:N-alpha-acetyltransferase 50-like [Condylostylus longicornis]|uniref:N-alpha-acetyltransferase 50-like n=1 Tax=Condylostylus longicornis TaxID=2530218 RepID=UPI00244E08C6|nr:N-alpha-acetyltransferase 50-like [Condylostylus longicornis]